MQFTVLSSTMLYFFMFSLAFVNSLTLTQEHPLDGTSNPKRAPKKQERNLTSWARKAARSSLLSSFHQFTSCHFTSLHFASLHFTSLSFASPHFPSFPFISFFSLHFPSLPCELNSLFCLCRVESQSFCRNSSCCNEH